MFVNNLLLPKDQLFTVSLEDTVEKALDIIIKNELLSIPVVKGKKFVGSVSKDLIYTYFYVECKDKCNLISLDKVKISEIVKEDIPHVHPYDNIEEAVQYFATRKISFVAVVDDNDHFRGIITHNDVFREFTELFGLNKGKRLSVIAFDIPGQISKLTKIISENGGNIISCVVADPKSALDVREIIIRIDTDNYEKIAEAVRESGFKVQ